MNFYISSEASAFEKCTEKLPKFPKRYTKKRKKKNDFGARLKNGSSRKAATLDDVTMTNCLVTANSFGHNWLMWTCTDVIGWLMTRWQISLDVTSLSLAHSPLSGKTSLRQECSLCFNEVFCFVPHPTINIGLQSKEWWDGLLNVVFSFMGGNLNYGRNQIAKIHSSTQCGGHRALKWNVLDKPDKMHLMQKCSGVQFQWNGLPDRPCLQMSLSAGGWIIS